MSQGRAQRAGQRRPYRQRVRAEASAATKQRILDAAYEPVMTLSYDDLTLSLVAERACVTVPTVLRHVGSKDGLLVEGAAQWVPAELERREMAPGDIAAVARVLAARYEATGDVMLRYIAVAERVPAIADLIEQARQTHRAWLEDAFAAWLPAGPAARRRRCVAQLFAATEVYCWMSWRRSLGLSARQAELALAEQLQALVTSWRTDKGTEGRR